jgi:hypothetical protein
MEAETPPGQSGGRLRPAKPAALDSVRVDLYFTELSCPIGNSPTHNVLQAPAPGANYIQSNLARSCSYNPTPQPDPWPGLSAWSPPRGYR